ncbi:MAG: DUF1573 domain-containing protein [Chitinophagales bacterium]|nr:DUF1573 domain-containing protein [Chitinophagales bacterium]
MKYLFTIAFLVFAAFGATAQTTNTATVNDPNGPKIEFESTVIDYGTINQYADGVRHFHFKNTGKKDLIISSCTGSCGCTVPKCPQEVIKPGKTAEIEVKYATDRIGQFTKNVTVNSNAGDPIILTIKGNVLKKEEGTAPTTTPNPTVSPN